MEHPESTPSPSPEPGREEPTVVDPGLYQTLASSDSRAQSVDHAAVLAGRAPGPQVIGLDDQKTVLSRRPPQSIPLNSNSPSAELGALLEGKQLGHFTLEQFVGGGGMGAVFRGHDNQLGRTVAVKVLSRDHGADPEMLRRFRNEAQSAARLDHENIARVFFVGEDSGWNYIVFEYIEGTNLRELVERRGPLPLEDAIDFTIQVSEALAHAAQRDVVHRDIKPSNVLITADGRAKLVDMGLARLHQMEAGQSDLTASGVTLGTFDYISPEQASDPRRADVRSDLYSLGCTLYFMLTGRPPFPQGTVLQKLLAHSGEPPPDPRGLRPDLPEDLTRILNRMLAKRPEQRYAHPADLVRELLVLRERMGLGDGSHEAWLAQGPLTWRERALAWGAPLALMLLVLLTMNAYWSRSGLDRPPEFQRPPRRVSAVGDGIQTPQAGASSKQHSTTNTTDVAAPTNSANNTSSPEKATSQPASGTNHSATGESPAVSGNKNANTPAVEDSPRSSTPEVTPRTPDETAGSSGTSGTTSSATGDNPATSTPDKPGPERPAPVDPDSDDPDEDSEDTGDEAPSSTPLKPTPPDTPAELNAIRRIVIGDASKLGDMGPEVRTYPTLHAALSSDDFMRHLATISTVEIAPGLPVSTVPLQIKLPPSTHLTLRGIVPEGPTPTLPKLRFALNGLERMPATEAAIEMSGAKLTLEDLHVEVTIDESVTADKVALFRLAVDEETHIELSHSILTLKQPGSEHQPQAAFFDVLPPTTGGAMMGGMPSVLPIDLKDTIVRGDAVLVRVARSLPLDLVWTNGLFISNQRLLEADGAKDPLERSPDGVIRLTLRALTCVTGNGLCWLQSSADRPHHPPLELESQECIFLVSGSGSLVEHDGVGDAEKYAQALSIKGSRNFYEGTDVFWRLNIDGIEQRAWDWTDWSKKLMPDGTAMMRSFLGPVRWQRLRSDVDEVPHHRQGVDDYLLEPEESNPAVRAKAGFDAAALPACQRIRPMPPEAEPIPAPLAPPAAETTPAADSP